MTDKNSQKLTVSPITGLTPQQEQACFYLASGNSVSATAKSLDVSRYTLYQWLQQDTFKCYYNRQVADGKIQMMGNLFNLQQKAVDTITDLLQHGSEQTRLKAATWIADKVAAFNDGAQTDIRAHLKERCTHDSDTFWIEPQLNEDEYFDELSKRGLL